MRYLRTANILYGNAYCRPQYLLFSLSNLTRFRLGDNLAPATFRGRISDTPRGLLYPPLSRMGARAVDTADILRRYYPRPLRDGRIDLARLPLCTPD